MNRLVRGSAALLSQYRIWLWADGIPSGLLRVVGGLAAVGFIGGISLAAPVILAPVAIAWCVGAWHAGTPPDDAEDEDAEPESDLDDPGQEGDFLRLLHQMTAATGRAHLAQIAEQLTGPPGDTARVRALCAAVGVPITPGVRVTKRGVSTGVYHRNLPPLPAPSESGPVAVVTAGQGEQQQQQHPGGEGFVILPDPDGNPHRHEVRWLTQPTRQAS